MLAPLAQDNDLEEQSGLQVQCGFGRVGSHFWGFELQSVVPDMVTLGKPIGNGFPMGAVIMSQQLAKGFSNGMEYFNTCGGCTAAAAAGKHLHPSAVNRVLQFNVLHFDVLLFGGLQFDVLLWLNLHLLTLCIAPIESLNSFNDFDCGWVPTVLWARVGTANDGVKPPVMLVQQNIFCCVAVLSAALTPPGQQT